MTKAEETRMLIIGRAFELMYIQGYQATSIDDIIAKTKVTKGAFYYHFKNKDDMGLAVISDLMAPNMSRAFTIPLQKEKDPVKSIYTLIKNLLLNNKNLVVKYGCPAANLSQEMSPLNARFKQALSELVQQWQHEIENSIEQGKKTGHIRRNVKAPEVSYTVMSGYWGIRNFGKLYGNNGCYFIYLKALKKYLEGLR